MEDTQMAGPQDASVEAGRERRTVGFVGLGAMGAPMAANLLDGGFALRVWNRSAERTAPVVERGAIAARRPGDVVQTRDSIVVTMLADDAALREVVTGPDGLLERLGAGGLHVSMSTVSPQLARELAEIHAGRGATYVSAPVFGRPEAARARRLWICVSGAESGRTRAQPLMRALGQGAFDVGDDPAAACVVKLAGNLMIAGAIEALGEACALVAKNGIEPTTFVDALTGTLFDCPVYRNYGNAIATGAHEPAGFRLELGLKDANLIAGAGGWSGVPLPLAELLRQRMRTAVEKGRGKLDLSALALSAAEEAGLTI